MKKQLISGKIESPILVSLALVSITVLGIAAFNLNGDSEHSGTGSSSSVSILSDHVKGNPDATILLEEYSDLQCPACGAYYPIVKQLVEEFGDNIKFTYHHFPLRQIHPNAELAAIASEAAGLQGKFWEMHDILFENQKEWSGKKGDDIFNDYAKEIGIDALKFESDMFLDESIKNKVENDYQRGLDLKVNSTPSFFIDGKKLQNPRSYEDFRSIIQQVIFAQ